MQQRVYAVVLSTANLAQSFLHLARCLTLEEAILKAKEAVITDPLQRTCVFPTLYASMEETEVSAPAMMTLTVPDIQQAEPGMGELTKKTSTELAHLMEYVLHEYLEKDGKPEEIQTEFKKLIKELKGEGG